MNKRSLSAEARRKTILSIVLGVICVIYVLPVLTVVINSFKLNTYVKTDTFALPNAESFAGWANFIKGLTFGNYPFLKSAGYSLFITIVSTALILLCTSMAAWYIARVDSKFCRMVYYLCIFSMVVPFQMVMEGITFGIVTFQSVCQRLAPSIFAASSMSSGTACRPAM